MLICGLGINFAIQAQTICYYKLAKTRINGNVSESNNGGQFICIYDDFCYDCDKNGKGIGNGQLHLKNRGEYVVYFGESYFGKNSYYKFSKNFGSLNIITPEGDIYAYKRATPPSNQTTCSLIRKKKSNGSSASTPTQQWNNNYYNGSAASSSNNNNAPDTPRQKTKVRKDCAYCSGKGERIQHESVSTYGVNGSRVYCNICNQSWSYGTVHAHHKCNHCRGTGYYEYEY